MSESKLFSRIFMYSILIIILVIAILISGIAYLRWTNDSKETLDSDMLGVSDFLQYRLSAIDKLYYALELYIQDDLKKGLEELANTYKEKGNLDSTDLEEEKRKNDFIDYYLIDQQYIIVKTTKEEALGLDFKEYDYFISYLDDVFDSDYFMSNRIDISYETAQLMKYMYVSTKDHKYIIQASCDFKEFAELIGEDSLNQIEKQILETNTSINSLKCYTSFGLRIGENYNLAQENPAYYEVLERAKQSNEIQKISTIKDNIEVVTLFIPYQFFEVAGNSNSMETIIYILEYDNEELLDKTRYVTLGFIILLFGIVIILFIIKLYYDYRYSIPMEKLLHNVGLVDDGEIESRFPLEGTADVKALANAFNHLLDSIEENVKEKEAVLFDIVKALANAVDAKDSYTGGHCIRVMEMSLIIGKELRLSDSQMEMLKYSSILHDIGKIGIPDEILKKPGKYDDDEYRIIQRHSEIGANILKDIESLAGLSIIIRDHHERIDGKGYPNGKSNDSIHSLSKIISIADAFDAMTTVRVYRNSIKTVSEAFIELKKCSGTQFDKLMVKVFEEAYIAEYGTFLDQKAEFVERR